MVLNLVHKIVTLLYGRKKCVPRTHPSGIFLQKPGSILGFSLLEIMVALCISATLVSIATMSYAGYRSKVTIQLTIVEIKLIAKEIDRFYAQNGSYPDSLGDLEMSVPKDSWGNPYRYLRIEGIDFQGPGRPQDKRRKDHDMVPVNNDYDLYSMGPDGDSRAPFTAKASQDDIVRVQNGKYIGTASAY